MTLIDFIKRIEELEIRKELFSIRDRHGVYYWDLIRYEFTIRLYRHLVKTELISPVLKRDWKKSFSYAFNQYFAFKSAIRLGPRKYVFFTFSRHRNDEGLYTDVASRDVLQEIKDDTLIIDLYFKEGIRYEFPVVCNLPLRIALKVGLYKRKLRLSGDNNEFYLIADILKEEFKVEGLDLNSMIRDFLLFYRIERKSYLKLLKRVRPEAVFFVQPGPQKAMIQAAEQLRIPTIELQHGLINNMHLMYSYTKGHKYSGLASLPTAFISFSDFWLKNTYFPVEKSFSVGNSFFSNHIKKSDHVYDLTIISSIIHSADMMSLIDDMQKKGFAGRMCLKLHPNQLNEMDHIRSHYNFNEQVQVVYNEFTIKQLLSVSNAILAIQSTTVYEALQADVKVFIYKVKDYSMHEDVFFNKNVYLISSSEELISNLDNKFLQDEGNVFFNKFSKDEFAKVLDFISDYGNISNREQL